MTAAYPQIGSHDVGPMDPRDFAGLMADAARRTFAQGQRPAESESFFKNLARGHVRWSADARVLFGACDPANRVPLRDALALPEAQTLFVYSHHPELTWLDHGRASLSAATEREQRTNHALDMVQLMAERDRSPGTIAVLIELSREQIIATLGLHDAAVREMAWHERQRRGGRAAA